MQDKNNNSFIFNFKKMKYFLLNTLLFIFIAFFITVAFLFSSIMIIKKGNNFSIKKNTKFIVLGHSHSECAFNDSVIVSLENYSQSGESYFYTFLKAKKIIESNSQIHVVFIEFTNNQILKEMDNWIWGDELLSFRYPKYSPLMNINEIAFLFSKNPKIFLDSQFLALKRNLNFILKSKTNFFYYNGLGGYLNLNRDKTDSLINILSKDSVINSKRLEISETNILYLAKTIDFCIKSGIQVYLIRSPIHSKNSNYVANETEFIHILKTQFNDVELLDFKVFPLNNNEFGDLEHLNFKGAIKFSNFFNKLIERDLLNRTNKQEYINNEMERINTE